MREKLIISFEKIKFKMLLKHQSRYAKKSAMYINLELKRDLSWSYTFGDRWNKDVM